MGSHSLVSATENGQRYKELLEHPLEKEGKKPSKWEFLQGPVGEKASNRHSNCQTRIEGSSITITHRQTKSSYPPIQ